MLHEKWSSFKEVCSLLKCLSFGFLECVNIYFEDLATKIDHALFITSLD